MQRRDLIRALVALPSVLVPAGGLQAALVKIQTGKHVMFVDDEVIDLEALAICGREVVNDPLADILMVSVRLKYGQTIDDVLRIYRIDD
jgi:hypothetical protein